MVKLNKASFLSLALKVFSQPTSKQPSLLTSRYSSSQWSSSEDHTLLMLPAAPCPQPLRMLYFLPGMSGLLGHLEHLILILQDPVGVTSSGNYSIFLPCLRDLFLLILLQLLPNALLLAAPGPLPPAPTQVGSYWKAGTTHALCNLARVTTL